MNKMTRGVVYLAFGDKAVAAARQSLKALSRVHPDLKVRLVTEYPKDISQAMTPAQVSRFAKVTLDLWSPFEDTLYLDADTTPMGDLSVGFDLLDAGWELVITPSAQQGKDWLWHVSSEERESTADQIGFQGVQLQAGVFYFRKTPAVRTLFTAWREEWQRWQGEDQGALLRALYANPVKVWLLGRPFNGGAVIKHQFGSVRQ